MMIWQVILWILCHGTAVLAYGPLWTIEIVRLGVVTYGCFDLLCVSIFYCFAFQYCINRIHETAGS